MRRVIFTGLCCMIGLAGLAQTVVLERETADFRPKPKAWGRNRANFVSPQMEMSWAFGPQARYAPLHILPSYNFRFGLTYKRKINAWFSLGGNIQYSAERIVLRQEPVKKLPDAALHERELYNIQGLVTGIFLRFNFDKRRGNTHGIFTEIGLNHVWMPKFTHITRETLPTGESVETRTDDNPYTLPSYGELTVKFGFYHAALFMKYRFSPLFRSSYHYPDPSPVKGGLEFFF